MDLQLRTMNMLNGPGGCAFGITCLSLYMNVSTACGLNADQTAWALVPTLPIAKRPRSKNRSTPKNVNTKPKAVKPRPISASMAQQLQQLRQLPALQKEPVLKTVLSLRAEERPPAHSETASLTSLIVQPSSSRKHGWPAGGVPAAPACCPTLWARTVLTR